MRPPRPIWYPNSDDDIQSIKEVVGYPFPIENPIKQVWNSVSRFGSVIDLKLDKDGEWVSVKYVHSSDDNVESFDNLPPQIQYQLKKASRVVSYSFYRIAVYGKRRLKRIAERVINGYRN